MKKNEAFRNWLITEDKKTDNVSDAYSSYLNAIEEVHGNVDEYFDAIIKKAIEKDMTEKKFKGKSARQVSNYKSGIKKYWQFYQSKMGIVPESRAKQKK